MSGRKVLSTAPASWSIGTRGRAVDIIFILSNLHRFIRQRRKPAPPVPAPPAPGVAALDPRKAGPSDRAFLVSTASAAALLLAAIAVLWSML